MRNFLLMTGFLLFIIVLLMVYPFYNPNNTENNKIRVVASFYPLYDVAKNIGQDKIALTQLVPFGKGIHFYEPNPQDVMDVANSFIFFYGGVGIDPWAEKLIGDMAKKDFALKASKNVQLLTVEELHDQKPHEEDEDDDLDEHVNKNYDPHFWLDFDNMIKIIKTFEEKIIETDPKNRDFYSQNAENYKKQILSLKENYETNLQNCKLKRVIVNHNAFQYLDKNYNFETVPVMGLSPDAKPNPKKIAELIEVIKRDNISTIFFESLVSDSTVKTIASETGIKTSTLNPLGNVKATDSDKGFILLMEENLINLKEALQCQ